MPGNGIETRSYFGGERDKDNLLRRLFVPPFLRRKEALPTVSEIGVERVENFVLDTYLGLDQTLRDSGHRGIVDFNLTDKTIAPVVTIDDAVNRFQAIFDVIDNSAGQVGDDWQLLKRELHGVTIYIVESQKPVEERIGTREAIKTILEAEPRTFTEDELKEDQKELVRLLNSDGLNCALDDPDSIVRAFAAYKKKYRLKKSKVQGKFSDAENKFKSIFIKRVNPDLDNFKCGYRPIKADEPYYAWARRDRDGFWVDLNLHDRNDWGEGDIERYWLHEVGSHLMMAYLHRKNIEEGKTTRALAVMPIPGARQYVFEAIAQTIHRGFPIFFQNFQVTSAGRISIIDYRLRMKLRTNALIKTDQGIDLDLVVAENRRYYPMNSADDVVKEIDEIREDLFWGSYLPSYSLGQDELESDLEAIGGQDRPNFLKDLFNKPLDRIELRRTVDNYKQKNQSVRLVRFDS